MREHIEDESGDTLCGKPDSTAIIINSFWCDVDPDLVCKKCKIALAKNIREMILNDFSGFRSDLESNVSCNSFEPWFKSSKN